MVSKFKNAGEFVLDTQTYIGEDNTRTDVRRKTQNSTEVP